MILVTLWPDLRLCSVDLIVVTRMFTLITLQSLLLQLYYYYNKQYKGSRMFREHSSETGKHPEATALSDLITFNSALQPHSV